MRTWGEYARHWTEKRDAIPIEDEDILPEDRPTYLTTLGDEWGTKTAVDEFVADYILPFLTDHSIALEIGGGGGRVVQRVAPHCGHLISFDVDADMSRLCHTKCKGMANVSYVLGTKAPVVIPLRENSLDFIYSFDTFVHLDQRTLYRYLLETFRVLRPGGILTIHVASHETKLGWTHFIGSIVGGVSQGQFGSFEYLESQSLYRMAGAVGFQRLKTTLEGPGGNFYYDRDLICVFCKAGASS